MFQIGRSKIIWPKNQYDAFKAAATNGIGKDNDDILEIAERAGILYISDDSVHYNEILAGELGIDLYDVDQAINDKIEAKKTWTTFEEYKSIRMNTRLTFEEFVEIFQIVSN